MSRDDDMAASVIAKKLMAPKQTHDLEQAQRLARHLAATHFPGNVEFAVMDTMSGVLSQIENMTCAWKPLDASPTTDPARRLRELLSDDYSLIARHYKDTTKDRDITGDVEDVLAGRGVLVTEAGRRAADGPFAGSPLCRHCEEPIYNRMGKQWVHLEGGAVRCTAILEAEPFAAIIQPELGAGDGPVGVMAQCPLCRHERLFSLDTGLCRKPVRRPESENKSTAETHADDFQACNCKCQFVPVAQPSAEREPQTLYAAFEEWWKTEDSGDRAQAERAWIAGLHYSSVEACKRQDAQDVAPGSPEAKARFNLARQIKDVLWICSHERDRNYDWCPECVLNFVATTVPATPSGEAVCWHCLTVLEPTSKPRCEDCPTECDEEGCDAPGCATPLPAASRKLDIALGYIKRACERPLPELPCDEKDMTERELAIVAVYDKAVQSLRFIGRELDRMETDGVAQPAAVEAEHGDLISRADAMKTACLFCASPEHFAPAAMFVGALCHDNLPVSVQTRMVCKASAIAALPAVPAQQWLDIETAPRDGSSILLAHSGDVWQDEWWKGDGTNSDWAEIASWLQSTGKVSERPTHWMSLPPPPAQKEGE